MHGTQKITSPQSARPMLREGNLYGDIIRSAQAARVAAHQRRVIEAMKQEQLRQEQAALYGVVL